MKMKNFKLFLIPILLFSLFGCNNKYDHEEMTNNHLDRLYNDYNKKKIDYNYVDFVFNSDFVTSTFSLTGSFEKGYYFGIKACVLDAAWDEICYKYNYQYDLFYECELDKIYDTYKNKSGMFNNNDETDFKFSLDNYPIFYISLIYNKSNSKIEYEIQYDENYMVSQINQTRYHKDEVIATFSLNISYR